MRRFILPFLKTQLDTAEEVATTLDSYGIDKIDSIYIKNTGTRINNKRKIDTILNHNPAEGSLANKMEALPTLEQDQAEVKDSLSVMGNQRFLKPSDIPDKTWKKVFKDFEWTSEVDITGENINKEALTTINTLITFMADPVKSQFFETPRGKFLFNKALQLTNAVSPLELSSIPSAPAPSPMQPEVPQATT